ncbi:ArsA family ATPase [Nakamurella lactea]|uniref:ArsA family ATPase n=1 Tax=Nakamurella lactea TaxID=459515 RepID=UPI0004270CBE|nr:ArsA-related P-loop ATPase [Nakamurella lactea]
MTELSLRELVADQATTVVVTCGSGGVGKTTTAAAMAVAAADAGRKVAVLTIDPARRLAQSLGLGELDNTPRRVELDAPGELWAMMLDTRRTFDEMVLAHSSKERAEQIFANPFYRTIATSFSGTQEYMAMEKLGTLSATGDYELIVVDTPPSRSALDFLDAPQRLSSFLDGRMIRLLVAPGRGVMKLVGAGLTLFTKAIRTVIGGQMLTDATQFVRLFEDLFGGFRERAEATYQLLREPGTRFIVVATPEGESIREASYFADRLRAEHMPLAGLVMNRTHPLPASLSSLTVAAVDAGISAIAETDPLTAGVLAVHGKLLAINAEERRMLTRVTRAHAGLPIRQIPALPTDVHDVADLRAISL